MVLLGQRYPATDPGTREVPARRPGWTTHPPAPTLFFVRTPVLFFGAAAWLVSAGTSAATLTVNVTHRGLPLEIASHGRVYVRTPEMKGAPKDAPVAWGVAGAPIRVADGTYDVVVKYVNDRVEHVEAIEGLALRGDVQRSVDFDAPIARLTLHVTHEGQPVARFEGSYRLYRAGQRGTPVAAKRPGDTLTILPGTYDIEIAWRGPHGLARRWLSAYPLRDEHVETVEMRPAASREAPEERSPGDGLALER